jgi:hypothetical protein
MTLELQPINFDEACAYITQYHRHHTAPQGCKFCIGVNDNGVIVGVIVIGRPVARMLDDGYTAEVTRCCTNGTKNTSSMLYSAAWRAARAMGYRRLITYTLQSEPGISLLAANWKLVGQAGGGTWNREDRPRIDKHPIEQKKLWEVQS